MHPIYAGWYYAFDLRIDIEPLLNLSINELKVEMKKSPKFLRTIRSNKAPIIVDAKYGMKAEPYSAMDVISVRMLQEIIVNLQHEEQITVLVTDHQAKELLSVTDSAMILSNAKIIAQDTPNNLLRHQEAIKSYFGSSFKLNS